MPFDAAHLVVLTQALLDAGLTEAQIAKVIHDTGADAVEMEGASVAHVAARNEVPALVIRALSDNADTDYEEFKGFDISEYADTAARIVLDILRRM